MRLRKLTSASGAVPTRIIWLVAGLLMLTIGVSGVGIASAASIADFEAQPSAQQVVWEEVCNESLGYGRVALDGAACVILDRIIVTVASGYTVDDATGELEKLQGWSVTHRLYGVRMLVAEYAPDNLTLEQLDAKRGQIAAFPWARRVGRDSLVMVEGGSQDAGSDQGETE